MRPIDRLHRKLLHAAVDATLQHAPDALVNELSICVGLLAHARQAADLVPEATKRAEQALAQWAALEHEGTG